MRSSTYFKKFVPGFFFLVGLILIGGCSSDDSQNSESPRTLEEGTFSYDVNFLEDFTDVIVLDSKDSEGKILITPEMQGRVMTSTINGDDGKSLGWVNHDLIESGEILEHFTPYGGEDRFWIAPEGGQYSVFITPGEEMVFENWYVPAGINTEPWTLAGQSNSQVTVEKDLSLTNYSNYQYDIHVNRIITILDKKSVENLLEIQTPDNVHQVAYESNNTIENTGEQAWTEESGAPAIWILNMFTPAPGITVVIPFKEGPEEELGPIATTDIFGEIGSERLQIVDGLIYFKVDGEKRRKIGVSPQRALPVAGSYDETNDILTIIQYSLPEENTDFVNQLWEEQEDPFRGEAVFAYNDGPLEDGSQLGPFYELESSSPAAFLKPGESLTHNHRVFHFTGSEEGLNQVSESVLGVTIGEIESAF